MIPLAGQNSALLKFLMSPMGEEVLEGTMTGGVAGLSQIGNDTTPQEIALKTVGGIAGGIGLGIAGRRIGAAIGKRINPNALKNQEGMLATFGRMTGSESTIEGLKHQGQIGKSMIQEALVQETSSAMLEDAIKNPNAFATRYGVTADQFQQAIPYVKQGRKAAAAARTYEMLSEKERHELVQNVMKTYKQVEQAVVTNAATGMDKTIERIANNPISKETMIPGVDKSVSQMLERVQYSLLGSAPPITGEHIGRAIGRFAGDEIGILAGMAGASALAGPLGMQSPKDIKIKELEQKLNQRNN